MARVSVEHNLGDLVSDLSRIPVDAVTQGAKVVKKDTREGRNIARRFARSSAGPHGKSYYKRITDEASGLEGEYGPTAVKGENYVGAGWRSGENTDLPRSADIIGPKLAKDVGEMVDSLFWPSGDR